MLVLKAAGLDMVHVPYRGVAPAFTDLLAGPHRDARRLRRWSSSRISNSGKVKPLAVLDTKPSPFLPDVPPVTDTLKDCPPAVTYNGLLGPARLPQEIADMLSRELVAAGKSPEFKQRLVNVGLRAAAHARRTSSAKIIVQADSDRGAVYWAASDLKQQ